MERILLTGATGYTGSFLTKFLLNHSDSRIGLLSRNASRLVGVYPEGRVSIYNYDETGNPFNSTKEAIDHFQPSAIIHLAGCCVKNDLNEEDIQSILNGNINFGVHLLHASKHIENLRFINFGTFWQFAKGTSEYSPLDFHAATKQSFQDLLNYWSQDSHFSAVTLIPYHIYGPNDPRGKLLSGLSEKSKLPVGDGESFVHFNHVEDVCKAVMTSLKMKVEGHEKYFLADKEPHRMKDVFNLVNKSADRDVFLIGERKEPLAEVPKPFVGSVLPNWKTTINLEEGIKDLL